MICEDALRFIPREDNRTSFIQCIQYTVKHGCGSMMSHITLGLLIASPMNPFFTQALTFQGRPPIGRIAVVPCSFTSFIHYLMALCMFKVWRLLFQKTCKVFLMLPAVW